MIKLCVSENKLQDYVIVVNQKKYEITGIATSIMCTIKLLLMAEPFMYSLPITEFYRK